MIQKRKQRVIIQVFNLKKYGMKTVLRKKKILMPLLLAAALTGCPLQGHAQKNVWCLKTNTGKYIELCRVSMMATIDGGSTFDILTKDGEGAEGVTSISFEKHQSNIDLSGYQGNSSDGSVYIDMNLPVWLQTDKGDNVKLKEVNMLANVDGRTYEVLTNGGNYSDVRSVIFYRSKTAWGAQNRGGATAIQPVKQGDEEQLQLLTPVRSQLSLSGCGDAKAAVVYSMNGMQVAGAAVEGGHTTIAVGDLPAGVYVVKVGKKALKFTKK